MKTILVTGASSGIGWALAIRAARAGYGVYAVGRNVDALDMLRAKIEAESGFVAVDATDIAIPANAAGLVARALAHFGSIDVLVNNAGFVSAGPLSAQSDAELQRQFGTHVIGPVALVRESLAALRAVRGHVFMLGSGVARVPVGDLGAYPPAKAAIRSATAILRRELAPQGIAVTYVDPGAVDTPFMTRAGMPGAPANILVSPEAVARKILIAVADRPRVLNAVAWQTAAVALAERFPRLTDLLLERAPALIGGGSEHPESALGGGASRSESLLSTPLTSLPAEAPRLPPTESAPLGWPPTGSSAGTPGTPPAGSSADADGAIEPERAHSAAELQAVPEATQPAPEPTQPASEAVESTTRSAEPTDTSLDWEPENRSSAPIETPSALDPHSFAGALEPYRRRMEKLNFRESFVRELLVADARLDVGDIALRWAGMPNKNERAITHDVLEALAAAGFLDKSEDQTYRVVRTP